MLDMSVRRLAQLAFVAVALFPITVVSLNVVQRRHYHPTVQAISELALGRAGIAMVLAFLGLGTGSALVGVLVARLAPGEQVVPAMLWLFALLAGPMSAFFHTDRAGGPTTWHGHVHDAAGLSAFVLFLLTTYVALVRFRRRPELTALLAPTVVAALVGTPAFFLVPILSDHFGLAQRIYVAVFVTWFLVVAAVISSSGRAREPRMQGISERPGAGSTPHAR
jgi:hypothetical protein